MDKIIHSGVAKGHFEIAQKYDQLFRDSEDYDQKKVSRIIAAQNYFYSAINAIEAVFAEKLEQHSFNHENRFRKMMENRKLFTDEMITLFEEVDRNERNRVAYKGENGKRYEKIKRLAVLLNKNDEA